MLRLVNYFAANNNGFLSVFTFSLRLEEYKVYFRYIPSSPLIQIRFEVTVHSSFTIRAHKCWCVK